MLKAEPMAICLNKYSRRYLHLCEIITLILLNWDDGIASAIVTTWECAKDLDANEFPFLNVVREISEQNHACTCQPNSCHCLHNCYCFYHCYFCC